MEEVLLGPGGLLDGLAAGAVWIDMSTCVPAVADRVRAVAAPRGIAVLDAPVSGMASGARPARCRSSSAAEAGTLPRARPLLEAMGDPERILHVGPHGAGYTVKLMINLLWFAHLTRHRRGADRGHRGRVSTWPRCAAACWPAPRPATSSSATCCRCCTAATTTSSFTLALACKDLGLAVDLARQTGVPAELSALVEQIYRRARAQYGDAGGEMLPIKLLEDLTGTPLRIDRPRGVTMLRPRPH